jgi:hypothetical protein
LLDVLRQKGPFLLLPVCHVGVPTVSTSEINMLVLQAFLWIVGTTVIPNYVQCKVFSQFSTIQFSSVDLPVLYLLNNFKVCCINIYEIYYIYANYIVCVSVCKTV